MSAATIDTLATWFRAHHPDDADDQDLARWPHTLPTGHTTIQLAEALTEWHEDHPDVPPRPAHIARLIREPGARRRIRLSRAAARAAIPAGTTTDTGYEQLVLRQRRRLAAMAQLVCSNDGDLEVTVDATAIAGAHPTTNWTLRQLDDQTWTNTTTAKTGTLPELLWAITCLYDPDDTTSAAEPATAP